MLRKMWQFTLIEAGSLSSHVPPDNQPFIPRRPWATALSLLQPTCPPYDELHTVVSGLTVKRSQDADTSMRRASISTSIPLSISHLNRGPSMNLLSQLVIVGSLNAAAFNSNSYWEPDMYIKVFDVEKMILR